MQSINRNAAVLKPKQPFLDWIHSLPGEPTPITLDALRSECSVYLVPEMEHNEQAVRYLQKRCRDVFESELEGWDNEESTWPDDLGWRTFKKWFDIEVHSMIMDLSEKSIEREDM